MKKRIEAIMESESIMGRVEDVNYIDHVYQHGEMMSLTREQKREQKLELKRAERRLQQPLDPAIVDEIDAICDEIDDGVKVYHIPPQDVISALMTLCHRLSEASCGSSSNRIWNLLGLIHDVPKIKAWMREQQMAQAQ